MKAENDEGEYIQQLLQGRQQVALADFLDADYGLHLGDLVDCIEMVEPFDAVQITLVNGIDAQKAGAAIREWVAALADPDQAGAGRPCP